MSRKVVILETQLKQYRRRFFVELAARLREHDIDLKVAYSAPIAREAAKGDVIELDGDLGIKVPGYWFAGERIMFQRAWGAVRDADMVILEQGNKHLFNHLLHALSRVRPMRIAYWGHGYNRQESSPGLSAWLKRKLATRVDWWFAYTRGVATYLMELGVAPSTITVHNNTIDTRELTDALAALTPSELAAERTRLGVADGARVALACGSLYPAKRLDLLIASAERVRAAVPSFELIIVGDGSERLVAERAAATHRWIHYVGPVFGAGRARYFALADMFVNPGVLGLAVVDAFAAGLPVFTTDIPGHGPEIEYVLDGVNGALTAPTAEAHADAIARALTDPETLHTMSDAARRAARELTLEHMVSAFADGISRCLERA